MTIVSLSVRYKSATVEEFIEKHAADVSGHGIFVKTDRAFSLGTLLQLDVRIADKQTLIAGVGRVVWRREASQGTVERPVGVGVQFLRIDKSSRAMVDRLLAAKPNAGRRYEAEAEGVAPPSEAPTSAPTLSAASRPAGAHVPAAARPKPGWHKATLMGVGQSAASVPPAPSTVLPRAVPPPRRPGTQSAIPPPPVTMPSKLLADLDQDPEDLTLIGDVPEMPEERKTTLVGVGAASAIAPRLPPPVAPPPRPNALALTPFGPPVGLLRPAVSPPHVVPPAVSAPPVPTDSAPLVRESDIEVAELLPPDTEDEPEEETRMQSMDELLGEVSVAPPPVATAPMLPVEPPPPAPMFPIEDDPMFPVESDPPPAVETARLPAPAPPAPRIPLPLVLPPREQFVPPMPSSVAMARGMVTVQTRARPIGVTARAAAASPRDKAIAAAGAALLVVAVAAFMATHPWRASEAGEPDAPRTTTAGVPHAGTGWSTIPPATAMAAATAPNAVLAPAANALTPTPLVAPLPSTPPLPVAVPPVAAAPPPAAAPAAVAPAAPPTAEAPVAAAPAPVAPSPPPRPKVQSAPAPPAAAPPTPTPAPAAVASASRPAPKPAAAPSRPVKPSVDDGF